MKTQFLKLFVIALVISAVSCKKETTLSEYKFGEKGTVLNCDNINLKLYNEALFSFEKDIETFYGKDKPNLTRAYSQFIRNAAIGRVKYEDIVSPHSLKVFDALKEENNLWNAESSKSYLSYTSPFFNCISNNIQNKDLKTTLNALVSTDSMNPKLFGTALASNYSAAMRDKYLAAYVAFDLYYAKLFNLDVSKVKESEQKVSLNDSHSGHNH